MVGEASPRDHLYLFTSNMRPLYEQDAIDVLAAASGTRYRFRYQSDTRRDYLGTGLRDRWRNNQLAGQPLLVCFSIQQEAGYHPSAFIPVRFGTVVQTRAEGSPHIVDFEIGKYASLALDRDRIGEAILVFSEHLKEQLRETPDVKKSAVLGPLAPGLDSGDEKNPLPWENAVEYLSRTLSFRNHVFIRYSGIREMGAESEIQFEQGAATLIAGRTYELRVTHLQPQETTEVRRYEVVVDGEIVSVVGQSEFLISSRYDTVPILLHAPDREDVRETLLTVRPSAGVQGASIRIRLRVSPNKVRQVGGAIGTAVSLLLIALPGILGESASITARVVLGTSGFLLGGTLLAARLRKT